MICGGEFLYPFMDVLISLSNLKPIVTINSFKPELCKSKQSFRIHLTSLFRNNSDLVTLSSTFGFETMNIWFITRLILFRI